MNSKTQMGPSPPVVRSVGSDGASMPDFRHLLSQFASGIVVLTTALDVPFGVTCQSFFSQSLNPPCIATSVSKKSSTLPHFKAAGHFGVNVLAADQAELATQFAKKDGDRWEGVNWELSPAGNPRISGALAWMDCRIMVDVEAGDHVMLIGEVLDAAIADAQEHPLIFFRGGFHTPLIDSRNPQ
jgi:3-hydroxy-9,10-secoandrosta-1,3,5(10)-triene-9,17-dione monooxygenase reductase component